MSVQERYFESLAEQSLPAFDAQDELTKSLTRIIDRCPPISDTFENDPGAGLYSGPLSIAYLFLRLHSLCPDYILKQQDMLYWAREYFDAAPQRGPPHVDANHCGIANQTLTRLALSAYMLQDSRWAEQLCSYADNIINDPNTAGSNEWLYGRSGYLYLLRFLKSGLDPSAQSTTLQHVEVAIQQTVTRILASPQPWTWHGKEYMGAAHGTIGIICQVVLSDRTTAQGLESILSDLLNSQFPLGNFPSSSNDQSDRLVQFCHGSPGVILSLRSIRPFFANLHARIDSAVTKGIRDVWSRGILTKNPCLCHGIAGNALALDSDEQFSTFLAWMSTSALDRQGWLHDSQDSPDSAGLYTGEAGRAWLWALALSGREKKCIG